MNYRYPEECCGYCVSSYINSYGDFQCKVLQPGNIIDIGGVCDSFTRDPSANLSTTVNTVHSRPVVDYEPSRSCKNCIYNFNDANNTIRCIQSGKVLNDLDHKCKQWDGGEDKVLPQSTEDVIETILDPFAKEGTCVNCKHSYLNEGVPTCNIDELRIDNTDSWCEKHELEETNG